MDFSKQPSEMFPITINFANWLVNNEIITSSRLFVNDIEVIVSSDIINQFVLTGTIVKIVVQNGLDGQDYKITSKVVTSLSNNYEYDVLMHVKEDCSCVYVDPSFCYRLRYDHITNELFIVPSPGSTLQKNTEYTVSILNGLLTLDNKKFLKNTYTFKFTSEYCPLFTTVTRVRLEIGLAGEAATDDLINRMIHKNSMDVIDILNSQGRNIAYDYFGCSWENVPLDIRRYVECKTGFDVLTLLNSLNPGNSQLKTLGDMTISYKSDSSKSDGAPDKRKQLYDCWNEFIRNLTSINTAVRGHYDLSKGYSHPELGPDNRLIKTNLVSGGYTTPGTIKRRSF